MNIVTALKQSLSGSKPNYTAIEDGQRKEAIERSLRRVADGTLPYQRDVNPGYIGIRGFGDWCGFAESQRDPDMIRATIYAAFQPLYDAIIDNNLRGVPREKAVRVLDGVITLGTGFLTGFYSGEPDVKTFNEGVAVLKPGFEEISGAEYYTKFRNIGGNRIYPNDIAIFLRKFLESTLDGAGLTDYVVGAACGSSEMAMPLAGLLGVDVGFIRKSKRRGDSRPRVIPEQETTIKNAVKGNRVVCVEDYVCTARSLRDVMVKVEDYGATSVIGASVANSQEGICLREIVNQRGFHTFKR